MTFYFHPWKTKPILKEILSLVAEFSPLGANSFHIDLTLLKKGKEKEAK